MEAGAMMSDLVTAYGSDVEQILAVGSDDPDRIAYMMTAFRSNSGLLGKWIQLTNPSNLTPLGSVSVFMIRLI
jgi:hypothetical protein